MIRYIQLPFFFDVRRMQDEVSLAVQTWTKHFNTADYEGSWTGISLRSPGGVAENIFTSSMHQDQPFSDTPLMDRCPYLREVLATLQCGQGSARLLKLDAGAVIKEHRDRELNFEKGEARLHIPVFTNEQVRFMLDGHLLEMKEGSCWYMNANLPHSVANNSKADRIHLVVDCVVNDWLRDQFEREDLPVKNIKDTSAEDRRLKMELIAALMRSGDPVRVKMGEEMEAGVR